VTSFGAFYASYVVSKTWAPTRPASAGIGALWHGAARDGFLAESSPAQGSIRRLRSACWASGVVVSAVPVWAAGGVSLPAVVGKGFPDGAGALPRISCLDCVVRRAIRS